MPVKNIAHENAKKAFAAIQNVKDNYSVAKKEYLSLVRGADAFIHQCGLLQTFAFYLAKGKTHHHLLIDQLLKHLGCFPHEDRLKGYQELLDEKDDMLMLHTAQTRQYLLWLKRYADAMLDEKKQDNGGGEDEGDRDSRQPENPQT